MSIKYPLKFIPILKDKIWGGEKLMSLLDKKSDKKNIGESWEISDVEGDTSVVSNGELEGKTLKELIIEYKDSLVGGKIYQEFGTKFPLLIKFIDAKTPLSVQLHPNDKLAMSRHNSFGKSEMWYIMQTDKNANMVVGFKEDTNSEEYLKHIENNTLVDVLNFEAVDAGDVYFISEGRVHAIGAGILLAEIQQTSDITYRIYDWDRVGEKGNIRKLHISESIDAIDYKSKESYKSNYIQTLNESTRVVDCPYFTTNILPIKGKYNFNHSDKDSFVIYMCVEGQVTFKYGENQFVELNKGETILIPAILKNGMIFSEINSKLLEVYIK
jgi:mannose-6-phosphate isomerase